MSEDMDPDLKKPSWLARVWEQVGTLVLAVAIALGIRAVLVEPYRIPSGSMFPTLLIGDHLFVNKFLYGARIPFSDWHLPAIRDPERGDVVVFQVARDGNAIVPADRNPDLPRDDFIKRLVGLPGDRIEVRAGVLYVNGEAMPRQATGEIFVDEYGGRLEIEQERLGECVHATLDDPRLPSGSWLENVAPRVVPPGRYFFMGDNRGHSRDSRDWGTVRRDALKGPAFLIYWSWDVRGNFLQFFNPLNWWSAEKRWGRVFDWVACDVPPGAGTEPQ
jgi:signal peptidase I